MDSLEDEIELEEQFIVRLPKKYANYLHNLIKMKPKKIKKRVQIELDLENGTGNIKVKNKLFNGKLVKLPTLIESLKTHNNVDFVKTADICYMLDCKDPNKSNENHGLTPPLKNVKKKRFRKCIVNTNEMSEDIQKELFYLLKADQEALSVKHEILYETLSSEESNKQTKEVDLFGEISSASEVDDNEDITSRK